MGTGANPSASTVCLPLLKIESFPQPNNELLQKSIALFESLYPNAKRTPDEINLLLAVIYGGIALYYYDALVQPPEALTPSNLGQNRAIKIALTSYEVENLKQTINSLLKSFKRLNFSYQKIRALLANLHQKPVLNLDHHTFYVTDEFTPEDFENFMLSTSKAEVSKVNLSAQSELQTYGDFFSVLENQLERLQVQLLGHELLAENSMPHSLIKLGILFKDTWENSDTGPLFNAMDELNASLRAAKQISPFAN